MEIINEAIMPAEAKATATKRSTASAKGSKKKKKKTSSTLGKEVKKRTERLFALDIGTRSVIGVVAEKGADGLNIIATHRQEHRTRAMMDGQIHDVPQVAEVISAVKETLSKKTGPIKQVAVAAAGRALYTMTATAEMDISGIITAQQERALDFAGVQAAQAKLAGSESIDDPSKYYCVGYSTISYELDGSRLKSLIGQRGKTASATVIATFLPRQVIDSIHSALTSTKLEMQALTLEPIAAINVLIPPTMRHLNLVLVDIGAGTSDVAITKNGSVIAYGMVPQAGDEITEAISQHFLLDFNIAEEIKRKAACGEEVTFNDILGMEYHLQAKEILEPIQPNIKGLAESIAKQILELNNQEAPQAIMLVGGGALTPGIGDSIAQLLSLPANRVAVRHPEKIEGILNIPAELQLPDAVTPLGILKIASANNLHFLSIFINEEEYNLFNFRQLTIADALLNAGIQLKKLNGRPGLGKMLTINGENRFIPGTMGTMATLKLNGQEATLDTPIQDGAKIELVPGINGTSPEISIKDILTLPPAFNININGENRSIEALLQVNGKPATLDTLLQDGDSITSRESQTLGEVLRSAGLPPLGKKIKYFLNDKEAQYTITPKIRLNDREEALSVEVHPGDSIEYHAPDMPKLGDVLNVSELDASLVIYYEGQEHKIPSATVSLEVNGHPASTNTLIGDDSKVRFMRSLRAATTVSDALLAVNFQPPAAGSKMSFNILVNKKPVNFTDPIKNGDELEVILGASGETSPLGEAPNSQESFNKNINTIPGLAAAISSSKNTTKSPFLKD